MPGWLACRPRHRELNAVNSLRITTGTSNARREKETRRNKEIPLSGIPSSGFYLIENLSIN
jgi:hypothetical protein